MSIPNIGDRVKVNEHYNTVDYTRVGLVGTVEAFDEPYVLVRIDANPGHTSRFHSFELEVLEPENPNADIDAVGQDYLDSLEAAVKDGKINDAIWRLGFIHAFVNDVEDALS